MEVWFDLLVRVLEHILFPANSSRTKSSACIRWWQVSHVHLVYARLHISFPWLAFNADWYVSEVDNVEVPEYEFTAYADCYLDSMCSFFRGYGMWRRITCLWYPKKNWQEGSCTFFTGGWRKETPDFQIKHLISTSITLQSPIKVLNSHVDLSSSTTFVEMVTLRSCIFPRRDTSTLVPCTSYEGSTEWVPWFS